VSDPGGVSGCSVFDERGDKGGTHAAQGTVFLRALEDCEVGCMDRALEPRPRVTAIFSCGLADAFEEGLGCKLAGDFAGSGSAHAIAHDEDPVFRRRGAAVLVLAANAARVGSHGPVNARDGRGGGVWGEWV
jgi:hypothetical protein